MLKGTTEAGFHTAPPGSSQPGATPSACCQPPAVEIGSPPMSPSTATRGTGDVSTGGARESFWRMTRRRIRCAVGLWKAVISHASAGPDPPPDPTS